MFAGRSAMTIASGLAGDAFISTIPLQRYALPSSLLAIFGELDTPEGVKANVRAITQILDQTGRRDYTLEFIQTEATTQWRFRSEPIDICFSFKFELRGRRG